MTSDAETPEEWQPIMCPWFDPPRPCVEFCVDEHCAIEQSLNEREVGEDAP